MISEGVHQTAYGYDLVWASNENYSARIRVFNISGAATDLYFQTQRSKTWFVNNGEFRLRWIDTDTAQILEQEFKEGQTYTVPINQPVQLIAMSDSSSITECGTVDHNDDIYRVIAGVKYEVGNQ
jgi:hypothetical protein